MPSEADSGSGYSPAERAVRAASFGPVALDYENARPSYPASAARWVAGADPAAVLDLGAGTGKLTRVLAAIGHDVVACEPLAEMAEVLASVVPRARVVRGKAERLPFAGGTFDAVTVAQAFHWFDVRPSLAELARVLKPGGTLGLVWNLRDTSVEWIAQMSRIIGSENIETDEPWRLALASSSSFGELQEAEFRYQQTLSLADLLALVRSRSIWVTASPRRRKRMLAEMIDLVHDTEGLTEETIALGYRTVAFRAQRL